MAGQNTLEFTDDNFQDEVMESDVPVLVDFWAEWCGPCRMLGPTIDELATEFAGRAKVGKVNVDNAREVAMQFGIQSIPTVVMIKGGQVQKKWVGIQPKSALAGAITAAL